MFKTFMDSNVDVNISLITFVKLKPWYVRPIIVRDTCCCRYHVEFEWYYETFNHFGIHCLPNDPPPSSVRNLYLKYYVHERMIKYSIRNNASVEENVKNVLIWLFLMLNTPLIQMILNFEIALWNGSNMNMLIILML